ncbi:methyltransferase domain-containing protein [Agrilactobacillus yilanensis]|uniref:Methyltransferase domain-containing protein n=1 Tax=Agrilactobacillus yilanensis TaxID=2485997 RepID=A0ABW4JAE1_9LACO|nr:methyltransferase domain-containing protein [Agrilactobacillus yilanensis]
MKNNEAQTQEDLQTAEFWDEFAADYAAIQAESQLPLATTITNFMVQNRLLPTGTLLDLGAGAGRFITDFAPLVTTLIEVDISQEMLNFGRQLAQQQQLKNIQFEKQPWSRLRQQQRQVSVVFASMFEALITTEDFLALNQLADNWVVLGHFTKRESSLDQQINQISPLPKATDNYNDDALKQWQSCLSQLRQNYKTQTWQFTATEAIAQDLLWADLEDRLDYQQQQKLGPFVQQWYQKKPTLVDQVDYTYQLIYWQPHQ